MAVGQSESGSGRGQPHIIAVDLGLLRRWLDTLGVVECFLRSISGLIFLNPRAQVDTSRDFSQALRSLRDLQQEGAGAAAAGGLICSDLRLEA